MAEAEVSSINMNQHSFTSIYLFCTCLFINLLVCLFIQILIFNNPLDMFPCLFVSLLVRVVPLILRIHSASVIAKQSTLQFFKPFVSPASGAAVADRAVPISLSLPPIRSTATLLEKLAIKTKSAFVLLLFLLCILIILVILFLTLHSYYSYYSYSYSAFLLFFFCKQKLTF